RLISATTGSACTMSPSEVTLTIRTRFINDLLVVRKRQYFSRRFRFFLLNRAAVAVGSQYGALHAAARSPPFCRVSKSFGSRWQTRRALYFILCVSTHAYVPALLPAFHHDHASRPSPLAAIRHLLARRDRGRPDRRAVRALDRLGLRRISDAAAPVRMGAVDRHARSRGACRMA